MASRKIVLSFLGLLNLLPLVLQSEWSGEAMESLQAPEKSIGATKPLESDPGTIHCDLAINIGLNVILGSDVSE